GHNPHSPHFRGNLRSAFQELRILRFGELHTGIKAKILYALPVQPKGAAVIKADGIASGPVRRGFEELNPHR
ncbi:MAG: hypothetical protein MR887_01825, partial [Clostridiales bacterium]|nr:hypothetical protein [Clostridiales bacterium]